MSSLRDYLVFSQWTNHQEGFIYGKVFTVNPTVGAMLIALLSIYTKTAVSHLFGIFRFLVFYFRSSPDPKHGWHHQFQAILRNQHNPLGTALDSTAMYETWRKHGRGLHIKAFRMFTFAASLAAAGYVASLFASRTSKTPFLIQMTPQGEDCGLWSVVDDLWDGDSQVNGGLTIAGNSARVIWQDIQERALDMAHVCYSGSNLTYDPSCIVYGSRLIPFSNSTTEECPLPGACFNDIKSVIFDSGYIDSLSHLGINTPKGDNIYLRVNQTCAPIDVTDYVGHHFAPSNYVLANDYYGNNQSLQYALQLGPLNNLEFPPESILFNETSVFGFWQGAGAVSPAISSTRGGRYEYILDPNFIISQDGQWLKDSCSFTPRSDIPWLKPNNQEISILALANQALYSEPVTDPLFNASDLGINDQTKYASTQAVRALACASRRYVCPRADPSDDGCLPVADPGIPGISRFIDGQASQFNNNQKLLIPRLIRSMFTATPSAVAFFMKSQGLLASKYVFNGFSQPLPDDQWVKELQAMFGSALVSIQITSSEMVRNSLHLPFPKNPFPANQTFMCGNQLFVDYGHTSFSVLGVTIIVVIGALLIIYEKIQPHLIEWLPPHTPLKQYRLHDWHFQNFYQLQRVAYESNNAGHWEGHSKVPTSEVGSTFPVPLHAFHEDMPRHESFGPAYQSEKPSLHEGYADIAAPHQNHGGAYQAYKSASTTQHAVYTGPRP